MTSFYFTVTTITTVGYGDMSASTHLEQVIVVFMMLVGVFAFSLASGSLTNYISQQEEKVEKHKRKKSVLDRLFKNHDFSQSLYNKLKKNIEYNHAEDLKMVAELVEELPLDLRRPLSIAIYSSFYSNVDFLKGKGSQFIEWFCPTIKTRFASSNECIYYDNDQLSTIYFLKKGTCYFNLPRFLNTPFIEVIENTCFGLIDFIAALLMESGDRV